MRNLTVMRAMDDFDSENGVLHVRKQLARKKRNEPARRGPTKSVRGVREIELLPEVVSLLKRHKADAFARGHVRATSSLPRRAVNPSTSATSLAISVQPPTVPV
ncbi:MAG TPA: hypothetical protein VG408_00660 [Actinomycetota bacterium]|nr:hypothetical protein [Actinomycetota bacterium]